MAAPVKDFNPTDSLTNTVNQNASLLSPYAASFNSVHSAMTSPVILPSRKTSLSSTQLVYSAPQTATSQASNSNILQRSSSLHNHVSIIQASSNQSSPLSKPPTIHYQSSHGTHSQDCCGHLDSSILDQRLASALDKQLLLPITERALLSCIYSNLVQAIPLFVSADSVSSETNIRIGSTFSKITNSGLSCTPAITGESLVHLTSNIIGITDLVLVQLVVEVFATRKCVVVAATGDHINNLATYNHIPLCLILDPPVDSLSGVFLPLTPCYMSTCPSTFICASLSCPCTLAEHNLQYGDPITTFAGRSSICVSQDGRLTNEAPPTFQPRITALWRETVSITILESFTPKERKRQEVIFELINGERDYVQDLEAVIKIFMDPLNSGTIIQSDRRDAFIKTVFFNINDLLTANRKLIKGLIALQSNLVVSGGIGDTFLGLIKEFEAYVGYGGHQVYAKAYLDDEKCINPNLCYFLDECMVRPELRKLPLESFLAAPTTRFARYPLLLKEILKYTSDDHPDSLQMTKARDTLQEILTRLNRDAGHAVNLLRLEKLSKTFTPQENTEDALRLMSPGRIIIREGKLTLLRRPNNDCEVTVFLFDHMLLVVREKSNGLLKIIRHPFPLELVTVSRDQFTSANFTSSFSEGQLKSRHKSIDYSKLPTFEISFGGRDSGTLSLQAVNHSEVESWQEAIEKQKAVRKIQTSYISLTPLWRGPIDTAIPDAFPTSVITWEGYIIVGGSNGVYIADRDNSIKKANTWTGPIEVAPSIPTRFGLSMRSNSICSVQSSEFTKIIDMKRVTKIDIQIESQSMLVLADKVLYTFPIDIIYKNNAPLTKGRRVTSPVSFFKQGILSGEPLVCTVNSQPLNSSIKIWKPSSGGTANPIRYRLGRFFHNSNRDILNITESLRVHKELYVPSESRCVDFLNSMLCIGSTKGFEMIQLTTLKTQGILDHRDKSLSFVLNREHQTPVAIFRLPDASFLLCFQEFAIVIDKFGHRARGQWIISFHGSPTHFAVVDQYLFAFDESFIEVRLIESGSLAQILTAEEICDDIAGTGHGNALDTDSFEDHPTVGATATPAVRKLRPLNVAPKHLYLAAGSLLGVWLSLKPISSQSHGV
ncbi:RHO1 GDP-GTP exchange protein 2 [Batrachochytrium dendrobatidis]|nr:RHO1 GDP-GTP exchange protein 2 [Batrachochytrium dendrobatidis]